MNIDQINDLFTSWDNNPGGAVAVIKEGEVVFRKAYGYADLENKILFTPETVIAIQKRVSGN